MDEFGQDDNPGSVIGIEDSTVDGERRIFISTLKTRAYPHEDKQRKFIIACFDHGFWGQLEPKERDAIMERARKYYG
jgi:hypothetical protein